MTVIMVRCQDKQWVTQGPHLNPLVTRPQKEYLTKPRKGTTPNKKKKHRLKFRTLLVEGVALVLLSTKLLRTTNQPSNNMT